MILPIFTGTGSMALVFREGYTNDLILKGRKSFWITEAGCRRDDGTFEAFVDRISRKEY